MKQNQGCIITKCKRSCMIVANLQYEDMLYKGMGYEEEEDPTRYDDCGIIYW